MNTPKCRPAACWCPPGPPEGGGSDTRGTLPKAHLCACRKGGWHGWKPSSRSNCSIRAFRTQLFQFELVEFIIEIRQSVSCRAIRGSSISVSSPPPPLLSMVSNVPEAPPKHYVTYGWLSCHMLLLLLSRASCHTHYAILHHKQYVVCHMLLRLLSYVFGGSDTRGTLPNAHLCASWLAFHSNQDFRCPLCRGPLIMGLSILIIS